jgi:hypothetical protein
MLDHDLPKKVTVYLFLEISPFGEHAEYTVPWNQV